MYSVGELVGYLRLEGGPAFDQAVMGARRSLDLTGESATKAGAAIGGTETKLAGAGKAAATLSTENGRLRAAQLSVVAAQERYNTLMAAGTDNTARLASAEASLLRAQDRLATMRPPVDPGGLTRLRTAAVGAVETIGKLGLSLGAFAVAAEAIDKIKMGAQFQKQMLMIQTNANASAAEVRNMSAALLGLAGPVGTAPDELATSLYHVEQNGLRGAKALDVVKTAAQGAQIGNADLEQTTNSMTAAVVSGIPGVQNMAQAMGALIAIVGTGDMKMSDLNEALGSGLLAVAKGYGLSLKDVGAALATFGDNNIRGANAATALRQAIMAFAKPAVTAKKGFGEIGLSLDALGKDMQSGGLNKAVQDLNSHMAAAGITGNKVGAFLTDAFGKKAGVGVNILIEQIDRFDAKQAEIAAGSGSFAAKWEASTHTAAFAFKQLSAEADAAGIVVYNKLQPALYATGRFLGATLPAAISETQRTLRPLEQEFDAVLVPALHLTADVLGLVGHGMEDVGGILSRHTGTVQVLGTVVIGMWAAWKGYTIARTAVQAVSTALDAMAVKAYRATTFASTLGSGMISNISPATLALGGIGIALGVAALAFEHHRAAVQADKQAVQDYTAALKEDNGVIGESTRQHAINALESSGAFDAARKLGIGLALVTDAALGNADALAKVNGLMATNGQVVGYNGLSVSKQASAVADLQVALGQNNKQLNKAIQVGRDSAEANRDSATATVQAATAQANLAQTTSYVVDAAGNLVQVQGDVANAAAQTTSALQQQKTAADLLKDSWDALDGTAETAEQTQNAFLDTFDALDQSVKQYGRSLDQASSNGRKNRETLVQQIDAAKAQAQATADQVAATGGQTAGLIAGNAQLARNEKAILSHAGKLKLDTKAVQDLIDKLGQLSEVHPIVTPDVAAATAQTKAAALKKQIDALNTKATAVVQLNDDAASPRLAAIQRQMDALNGKVAHVTVQVNTDASRAIQDAANAVTSRGPGGHTPARASGGGVSDGWFTMNEQGWELGHKQGSRLDIFSHEQSKKMLPQGPSVPAFASGTKAPKLQVVPITVTAGGGAAYGIASYIKGQIPSVRSAVRLLSEAVDDAFQLKGVQAKLAAVKADLASVVQARGQFASGVLSSLTGQVDLTKIADPASMIAALQYGTTSNQRFTAQEQKLAAEHVPDALIRALSANGPNAGLDALAGAGKGDLAQIVKNYSAFNASAQGGGSVAGNVGYGSQIAADRQAQAKLTADTQRLASAMSHLGLAVAELTKRPVEVRLDDKVVATTKYVRNELLGFADELRHVLVTGRSG